MSPKVFQLASSLLLLSTIPAFCQIDDILANSGTFRPKITVSDSYSEKVLVDNSDGYLFRSVEAAPQRIAITIVANLNGADVGVIDADTSVGFSAGYFSHSDSLGEAPD